MSTFICMKWGTRYGPEYVNRLQAGVRRNMRGDHRFICFTDDGTGLNDGVDVQPLPPINLPDEFAWTPWRKLSVWQYPLAGIEGDLVFLDLDLLVTGPLDDLFTYEPGRYCVIENFTQRGQGIGNTSAFRIRAGQHTEIFDIFNKAPESVLADNRIEQQYISRYIPEQVFWPRDWCASFKHDLVPSFPFNWFQTPPLPPEARIVAFTGRPDIPEALAGEWPAPLHKKFYKHTRPATWIADHWQEN